MGSKRDLLQHRARSAITERLPDLYAQRTPRKKRLTAKSSRYWLSGYPSLVAQYHSSRNGDLFPDVLSYGSTRSVWWRCPVGPDHEWEERVGHRVRGAGCPYCAGKRASVTNSLAALHPEIADQWHASHNGDLRPDAVTCGSKRMAWWTCPVAPEHAWKGHVAGRVKGAGCPYCAGRRVSVTNSLATLHPKIAAEWHPKKNGKLSPADIVAGSKRCVWWKCRKANDHIWQTRVCNRTTLQAECPFCNGYRVANSASVAKVATKVAREWHATKNGRRTPHDVGSSSHVLRWWRCRHGHEWHATPHNRIVLGRSCPYCAGYRLTPESSLAARYPDVAQMWHPTLNGDLTPHDVSPTTRGRLVWWQCDEGHEWERAPGLQMRCGTCPYCSGKWVTDENSLRARFPAVAAEWHRTKNGALTPDDVKYGSSRMIWWRCSMKPRHIWIARVGARTTRARPSGCPDCALERRRKAPR